MKKMFCAVLCLAVLGTLTACSKKPETEANGPRVDKDSVKLKALTIMVAETATQETMRLSGRLGWDETRTVRVFAPLGGRIVKLVAMPGDTVKANDVLATLTSPDFGE